MSWESNLSIQLKGALYAIKLKLSASKTVGFVRGVDYVLTHHRKFELVRAKRYEEALVKIKNFDCDNFDWTDEVEQLWQIADAALKGDVSEEI